MNEIVHKVSGRKVRMPAGRPGQPPGPDRRVQRAGHVDALPGALGSSVVKIFDATAASTGLTENGGARRGLRRGRRVVVQDHHAGYYPGAKEMVLKLVYDRKPRGVLGGQAFGDEGVEKRIDVIAMALQGRLTLQDLAEVDLAYAPPYSSANDPVNVAAFVGQNDLRATARWSRAGGAAAPPAGAEAASGRSCSTCATSTSTRPRTSRAR